MIGIRVLLLASTLALTGCSLAPKTVLPTPPVPQSWPVGDAYLLQSEAALPILSYQSVFTDPRLQALAEQALTNNRDLRVAYANVAAARAQARVTRAGQFPELGISGGAGYSDSNGASGSGDFSLRGGVTAFELDLFGKLANATEADRNRALATEAASRTVRLALIANLAEAWATYGADRDLLKIAEDTAANARESVRLTKARLDGGVAPRTDLRQAEQILATAEDAIAQQRTALAQDENLIRLLVGGDVDRALLPAGLTEVTPAIAALPAGISSEILLRRPDVIEAEYGLRAANADIGVARAQLFPSISLTGLLGFASNALSSLFDSGSFSWSAGGDVTAPIFDAGGRRAGVAVSEAQRDAALAGYEGAIQTAFREVADALAVQGTIAERVRAAAANTAAAADTATLTDARYKGGIDSFLTSLDAQRSLYAARRSEIATQLLLVQTRIALFRALGGDSGAGVTTP
ncbi:MULTISPECIES: efflux transporter outer membrane subunit [unclassified Sphingopyxis]|jgi:outer membrane protein, multidrug efflux system|uniref:efflux transporter outer membrane subunit n=1 Tax=unclassified Sphingopyxis TaxID=2614943 RepID=UPI00285F83B3|nr:MULTISPECIES: efflux transporter outer membrane subunit [unclassified Sphingopyxis]MDR6833499.1 multidrug efflux system outer membrane protein [Sphingopyxis sp. BE122]MDR7225768.1 multidrug efflux system outer membrane protein [Sphingopyxis sp. BE259]